MCGGSRDRGGDGTPTRTPALPGRAEPSGRFAAKFFQLCPLRSQDAPSRDLPESRAPGPGPARTRAPHSPARRRRPSSSNFAPGIEIPPRLRPSIRTRPRPSLRPLAPRSAPAPPPRPAESGSEARPRLRALLPEPPRLAGPPGRAAPSVLGLGAAGGGGQRGGGGTRKRRGVPRGPTLPFRPASAALGVGERATAVAWSSHARPPHGKQSPGAPGARGGPAHLREGGDVGAGNAAGRGGHAGPPLPNPGPLPSLTHPNLGDDSGRLAHTLSS